MLTAPRTLVGTGGLPDPLRTPPCAERTGDQVDDEATPPNEDLSDDDPTPATCNGGRRRRTGFTRLRPPRGKIFVPGVAGGALRQDAARLTFEQHWTFPQVFQSQGPVSHGGPLIASNPLGGRPHESPAPSFRAIFPRTPKHEVTHYLSNGPKQVHYWLVDTFLTPRADHSFVRPSGPLSGNRAAGK